MTPHQRDVLERAGITVTNEGTGIWGIPVKVVDGFDDDSVIIVDIERLADLAERDFHPIKEEDRWAWKVRF